MFYLTNRFHVAVRLFGNRSQMTSTCGKNKKVAHILTSSVICYWTDARPHGIYLFYIITSPVPEFSFLPAPYRGWTRAGERRVQGNLHAHAQNAAIPPPPKSGENHIWKYFPDSACGAIFWIIAYKQQFLHSDRLKTCQLIPNQWSFSSSTLNPSRFAFYNNIKDNERNLCQDLLAIKNTDSDLKVHALHYANELMSYLYASDFSFKNSSTIWKICLGKE